MGGNALKKTPTRRYLVREYFYLSRAVRIKLLQLFPDSKVEVIPSYKHKESFGDCDILLQSDNLPSNWVDIIKNEFTPNEIVKNGKVLSFDVEQLQFDIITCPLSHYWFSYGYYSYNDLGNLIGRIAHKMGFKFGHAGLQYVHRDDHYIISEITITTDFYKALEFLKLPTHNYSNFNTLEDIYWYVAGSHYFNPDIYLLENLNHISRTRDRKRETYRKFLVWCQYNNSSINHYEFHSKGYYLNRLRVDDPEFNNKYLVSCDKYDRKKKAKLVFNGTLVNYVTGLDGKELGCFMAYLTPKMGPDKEGFILSMSSRNLKIFVEDNYETYKEEKRMKP